MHTQREAEKKWCPDRKGFEKYTAQFCCHARCGAWVDKTEYYEIKTGVNKPWTGKIEDPILKGYCGKYQGCKCKQ